MLLSSAPFFVTKALSDIRAGKRDLFSGLSTPPNIATALSVLDKIQLKTINLRHAFSIYPAGLYVTIDTTDPQILEYYGVILNELRLAEADGFIP